MDFAPYPPTQRLLNPSREMQRHIDYRLPPMPGGGDWIQGTIDSVDTEASGQYQGLKVAVVTVVVASCSQSGLIGDQVDVVDHSECIFNEADEDLLDRWIWASKGISESLDPEADAGTLTDCHWVADDICCPE